MEGALKALASDDDKTEGLSLSDAITASPESDSLSVQCEPGEAQQSIKDAVKEDPLENESLAAGDEDEGDNDDVTVAFGNARLVSEERRRRCYCSVWK